MKKNHVYVIEISHFRRSRSRKFVVKYDEIAYLFKKKANARVKQLLKHHVAGTAFKVVKYVPVNLGVAK